MYDGDRGLYDAASRHFGKNGWAKARVFAGFDPIDPRPWTVWSEENVVEEIQRLYANGVSLNTSALQMSNFSYILAAGRTVFGNWKKAIKEANLDYKTIRLQRPPLWTRDRIIAFIQALEESGMRLSVSNIQPKYGGMFRAVTKRFGCWSQAVEAAGINYRKHCRSWSTKAWLRRMSDAEYKKKISFKS